MAETIHFFYAPITVFMVHMNKKKKKRYFDRGSSFEAYRQKNSKIIPIFANHFTLNFQIFIAVKQKVQHECEIFVLMHLIEGRVSFSIRPAETWLLDWSISTSSRDKWRKIKVSLTLQVISFDSFRTNIQIH